MACSRRTSTVRVARSDPTLPATDATAARLPAVEAEMLARRKLLPRARRDGARRAENASFESVRVDA
jgi:hypothetical protein